ncbi:MAG: MinD/ParA family protein [Gammaproteobacteria bacterium]|nr:MinD/ParA family protein [Gammaproteobacteria bacterium]
MSTSPSSQPLHRTKVIAVTSGKGGVGKTNVSINLAIALSQIGHKVTLLDADLGLANIDVLLNLRPLRNLAHVIRGECGLEDIIIPGPLGINIVPAASGVKMMSSLSVPQQAALIHAFGSLDQNSDALIIDTSAGLNTGVVNFCTAAHEILVVVCNEPASVADAYAMIKVLRTDYGIHRFRVLVNMAQSHAEGRELFTRLSDVTQHYLDVILHYCGVIPRDPLLLKAVRSQRALLAAYPSSPAGMAFKDLANTADKWVIPDSANGRLEFFVEKLARYQPGQAGNAMP